MTGPWAAWLLLVIWLLCGLVAALTLHRPRRSARSPGRTGGRNTPADQASDDDGGGTAARP